MAFLQAMNAPDQTKVGVNGAHVYTSEGVENDLLALFTMLNRDLEASWIDEHVNKILQKQDNGMLRDLLVLAFQTRDVRGGKGERTLFYNLLSAIYRTKPTLVHEFVHLIPHYGSWFDMWEVYKKCRGLILVILKCVKKQYAEDYRNYMNKTYEKMSLLSKWLPREHSKSYPGLADTFANHLFSEVQNPRARLMKYRKQVSQMNKALKTVEINMCGGTWAEIIPKNVPGRNMKLHKRAFLNLQKGKDAIRFPDNEDRNACREHFLEYIASLKKGTVKAKGANVVFPHEIVEELMMKAMDTDETDILQGLWDSIREETMKLGGFRRMVPMCDFSGSMDGLPKMISASLGLLLSEVNHPAFRDAILTFDSNPSWMTFAKDESLYAKVKQIRHSTLGLGMSTDFHKACMAILKKMVDHKVPVGEEPEDLIVLTDMGWDDASDTATKNPYRARNESRKKFILEEIQQRFQEEGEKLWGAGQGWKVPRIIVWNLRAEFKDFQAKATTPGVLTLSGWSPAVLKALQTGNVDTVTPMTGLRILLDDPRYDPVREVFDTVTGYTAPKEV